MEKLETIWRVLVVGLMVCRLTHLFLLDNDFRGPSPFVHMRPEDFLGRRLMDLLYWLNVWISARTALWAACGFGGVFLAWVVFSSTSHLLKGFAGRTRRASRLLEPPMTLREDVPQGGFSPLMDEPGMQTNHG